MPARKPQQYIAFLRGINVGGRRVSMQRLCACFTELKLLQVRSFIASGNIIFECDKVEPAALERQIESTVLNSLSFESPTFLRTPDELRKIIAIDPFADETDATFRRHIVFIRRPLAKAQEEIVMALSNDYDQVVCKGKEIFWLCRGPFHQSKIKQPALTKAVDGPWTARNVQTVTKLALMFDS